MIEDEIIQLTFSKGEIRRLSFSKDNLSKVAEEHSIKDYASVAEQELSYSVKSETSENNEYTAVLVTMKNKNKEITDLYLLLFDKELHLIKESRIRPDFIETPVAVGKLLASDNGKAAICFLSKKQIEVAVIEKDEEEAEFIPVSLENNLLLDYTGCFDKKGNIILAGYFSGATFSILVDTKTKSVGDIQTLKFPSYYDNPKNKYSAKAEKIVIVNENMIYLVGYEFYMTKYYYERVMMSVVVESSRCIIVTHLNGQAEPQKTDLIFTSMGGPGLDATFFQEPIALNFCIAHNHENLYILYFDNIKNMNVTELKKLRPIDLNKAISNLGVCMLASFDSGGNSKKEIVYNNSKEKIGLMFPESMIFDAKNNCFKGLMAKDRLYPYMFKKLGARTLEISIPE